MSNHTPGPWFAYGRYIGTKNHASFIGECRDINGNWSNEAPASANARLIAAAPDLLDALHAELQSLLEDLGTAESGAVDGLMARITRIETVLDKAEGRA